MKTLATATAILFTCTGAFAKDAKKHIIENDFSKPEPTRELTPADTVVNVKALAAPESRAEEDEFEEVRTIKTPARTPAEGPVESSGDGETAAAKRAPSADY